MTPMVCRFTALGPQQPDTSPSSLLRPLKPHSYWPWQKGRVGPTSVSPMGFGTWAWGNQLLWGYDEYMDDELQSTFDLALENGINLFDTADSNGTGRLNGRSERLLGKFVKDFQGNRQDRDDVVIATMFAAYPWLTYPGTVRGCLQGLSVTAANRPNRNWTVALVHRELCASAGEGALGWFSGNVQQGVSVSNYGPKQLVKIHDYLKTRGVPLSSAQVQFSLLSMGEEQFQIKEICDSLGVRLIAYSPLGLGMLTGNYTTSNLPGGPRAFLFRQILPGLKPLLNALEEIAKRRWKTMPQVGINCFICKGTIPIPGVKSVKQAEDNLGALGWRLNESELLQLEDAARESPRKMIQNILKTK